MAVVSKPIQIIPPGLLGFLQLKNGGVNPQEFPDLLQPVLEMRDWMFTANAIDFGNQTGQPSVQVATGVVGFTPYATNPIVVPQDQQWWVFEYAIEINLLAATDFTAFVCAYRTLTAGVVQRYSVGDRQDLLQGAATTRRGIAHSHNFFVQPGAELGVNVQVNETAAANLTYTGYLRYVPLPI